MLKSKANEKSAAMAALMEEYDQKLSSLRSTFRPGETIQGTVLSIGSQYLVLDINAPFQGILNRDLFNGSDTPLPSEGDTIDVCFMEMQEDGTAYLTLPGANPNAGNQSIEEAYVARQPIEGVFEKEVNGGYEVRMAGERAFCPFSQVALRRPREGAPSPLGTTQTFLIIEYNPRERTLVVSHRALEERERETKAEKLRATLHEGDVVEGVVTKLMPFGVFVDIGGVEGLIPNAEISWDRSVKPADVLQEGMTVQVCCRRIDWDARRLSFSLKDTQRDPWLDFAASVSVGDKFTGTVVRLMPFGAFVQLKPGVEGLIPISRLGNGRALANASEVLKEGQLLEVRVESVDAEGRRLSLSVVSERVEALQQNVIAVGAELKGIVESVRPFGVFVRLNREKTGLLHAGETGIERGPAQFAQMQRTFAVGSDLTVVVIGLEGDRISLSLPSVTAARDQTRSEEERIRSLIRDAKTKENESGADFGNLGSVFDSRLQ